MTTNGKLFTDTSEFYAIGPGDEIVVENHRYLVKGEEREYHFGIEDPKFWVKKVVADLQGYLESV